MKFKKSKMIEFAFYEKLDNLTLKNPVLYRLFRIAFIPFAFVYMLRPLYIFYAVGKYTGGILSFVQFLLFILPVSLTFLVSRLIYNLWQTSKVEAKLKKSLIAILWVIWVSLIGVQVGFEIMIAPINPDTLMEKIAARKEKTAGRKFHNLRIDAQMERNRKEIEWVKKKFEFDQLFKSYKILEIKNHDIGKLQINRRRIKIGIEGEMDTEGYFIICKHAILLLFEYEYEVKSVYLHAISCIVVDEEKPRDILFRLDFGYHGYWNQSDSRIPLRWYRFREVDLSGLRRIKPKSK